VKVGAMGGTRALKKKLPTPVNTDQSLNGDVLGKPDIKPGWVLGGGGGGDEVARLRGSTERGSGSR